MRRWSLRLRLTLVFASVMALVLGATGAFLYLRLGGELDRTIDQGLRSRAQDVAALVRQADTGLSEGAVTGDGFAQVLDARGRVLDATPAVSARPLLTGRELAAARRARRVYEHPARAPLEEPVRVLAVPVRAQDQRVVVVVGSSLEQRRAALGRLGTLLLVGGPIALLLASGAGYLLTGAALRPVEAMRTRAAALSAADVGERLPVPPGEDEIARLGATLNDMLGRLQAALARERAFVADASHELLTPLSILQAELELAAHGPGADLPARLGSAQDETARLVRLARDLLLLARSDGDGLPLRRTAIGGRELLEATAARFARAAAAGGRAIEVDAPAGLVFEADELRVEQALGNLVDNALRHGAGTVLVALRADPDGTRLEVSDEGEGFPPAFAERAFERFARVDGAAPGGAGLGLAIVAMVASAHGGAAGAANRRPRGAMVWLTLPGAVTAPAERLRDGGAGAGSATSAPRSRR